MEVNRIKQMQRLRSSIPDMQKTLETVKFLELKQVQSPVQVNETIQFRVAAGSSDYEMQF